MEIVVAVIVGLVTLVTGVATHAESTNPVLAESANVEVAEATRVWTTGPVYVDRAGVPHITPVHFNVPASSASVTNVNFQVPSTENLPCPQTRVVYRNLATPYDAQLAEASRCQ